MTSYMIVSYLPLRFWNVSESRGIGVKEVIMLFILILASPYQVDGSALIAAVTLLHVTLRLTRYCKHDVVYLSG